MKEKEEGKAMEKGPLREGEGIPAGIQSRGGRGYPCPRPRGSKDPRGPKNESPKKNRPKIGVK